MEITSTMVTLKVFRHRQTIYGKIYCSDMQIWDELDEILCQQWRFCCPRINFETKESGFVYYMIFKWG